MSLYVGAKAPEYIDFVIPASADFDPSTVTSWTINVRLPNGSTTTWSHTVEEATVTQARLRHVFEAAGGDVPSLGDYRFQITCDTPGGGRRSFRQTRTAQDV